MIRSTARLILIAVAALAAPGALQAQAPAVPENVPPEIAGWLAEIQELHIQLTTLQEKALQDPALAAQRDSLGNHIRVAMESIDPSLPESMERIEAMEAQAAAAEAASDDAKLTELRAEAQQIEQQFLSVQQRALQQPELAAEISAFQSALEARILETDPEAPRLLERFQELEQKLAEAAS